jgi:hypothetical protein
VSVGLVLAASESTSGPTAIRASLGGVDRPYVSWVYSVRERWRDASHARLASEGSVLEWDWTGGVPRAHPGRDPAGNGVRQSRQIETGGLRRTGSSPKL